MRIERSHLALIAQKVFGAGQWVEGTGRRTRRVRGGNVGHIEILISGDCSHKIEDIGKGPKHLCYLHVSPFVGLIDL